MYKRLFEKRGQTMSRVPHRIPFVTPIVHWRLCGERLVTRSAKCLRQTQRDAFKSRRSVGFGHVNIDTVRGEILAPSDERAPRVLRIKGPAAESDGEETDCEDTADSEEEESAFETLHVNAEGYWDEQRQCERNENSNDRGDDMFGRSFGSYTPCLKETRLAKDVVGDKASRTKGTNTSVIASRISVPIASGTTVPSR